MADKTVNLVLQNPSGGVVGSPSTHVLSIKAPPTITLVNPAFGPELTATPVTITGTDFQNTGVDGVTFGGVAATSVVVVNETTITCDTPASILAGFVDVQLRKAGANIGNALSNGYEFQGGGA